MPSPGNMVSLSLKASIPWASLIIFFVYRSFTDDAYYYLYYGSAPRPPSYFALELEEVEVGRVLRFDSLSKILSGGIRVGFASGPEALLAVIDLHVRTYILL